MWASPSCPRCSPVVQAHLYEAGLRHPLPGSSGHFRAAIICTKAIKTSQPFPGVGSCVLLTCKHSAVLSGGGARRARGCAQTRGYAECGAGSRRALIPASARPPPFGGIPCIPPSICLCICPSFTRPICQQPWVRQWPSLVQLVGYGSPPCGPPPLLPSASEQQGVSVGVGTCILGPVMRYFEQGP